MISSYDEIREIRNFLRKKKKKEAINNFRKKAKLENNEYDIDEEDQKKYISQSLSESEAQNISGSDLKKKINTKKKKLNIKEREEFLMNLEDENRIK